MDEVQLALGRVERRGVRHVRACRGVMTAMTLDGPRYSPDARRFDEVFDTDGAPRPTWAGGRAGARLDRRRQCSLDRQHQADRLLDAEGTGHLVHELSLATDRHGVQPRPRSVSRPWRLDPMPFVARRRRVPRLAAGGSAADARARGAARRLLRPATARRATACCRRRCSTRCRASGPVRRPPSPPWLVHYALDVVRGADGVWQVVRDLTDTPTGLGYALLVRTVVCPGAARRAALAGCRRDQRPRRHAAPRAWLLPHRPDGASPRSVVLTPGPATRPTSSTATSPRGSATTSSRAPTW